MTDSDFRITADTYVVRQCNGGDMCPAKGTEFILTATGAKNIIRLTCVNGDFPGLVNNQGFFCSTQTKQGVELTAVFVYASGEQALTRISLRRGKGKTKGKAIFEAVVERLDRSGDGQVALRSGGGGGGGGDYGGTRP